MFLCLVVLAGLWGVSHVYLTAIPRNSLICVQMTRETATIQTVPTVATTGVVLIARPVAQPTLVDEQGRYHPLPAGKLSSEIQPKGQKVMVF